ncbi:MAG: hypothetical protein ACT4QD_09080 [Acidobacteriota bacterium]
MTIEPVRRVLESLDAPYALIGAHAMAARGYPRFTVDVDLLTTDARVLDRATWATLEGAGAAVEPRRGDEDDPLAGVVHLLLADGTDIDVVLAKWRWQAQVIARAERMTIAGVDLPVPQTSDLILLKLAAGGYLDLRDAAALVGISDRVTLVRQVEEHIGEVSPDVRALWRDLLSSLDA